MAFVARRELGDTSTGPWEVLSCSQGTWVPGAMGQLSTSLLSSVWALRVSLTLPRPEVLT